MRDHPPSACAPPESQLHATIQISVTKYLPIHAIFSLQDTYTVLYLNYKIDYNYKN